VRGLDEVAAELGGRVERSGESGCVVIDRDWDADERHGRPRVGDCVPESAAPLALFDPKLAPIADWASRVVFFDIETTGLSGGAGTLAFLAGCGWFDQGTFRVRQFLLCGPAGERAMLDALGHIFEEASLLVTFNGRSFDVPVMDMRWSFHRRQSPVLDVPHFDMLPPARRLWGTLRGMRPAGASSADPTGCSLGELERAVLGFHRLSDVPGFEIPARYFAFLRYGDASALTGVLEHNQHDLVSLAVLAAHALRLGAEGSDGCRDPREQFGLGRLYERANDHERAVRAYTLAAASSDRWLRAHALARLAVLMRREGRHDESARAWGGVLEAGGADRLMTPLERRAAESLAIHHEHRARDLAEARRFAELLRRGGDPAGAAYRLGRINRKLDAERAKGGPAAAPLLDES